MSWNWCQRRIHWGFMRNEVEEGREKASRGKERRRRGYGTRLLGQTYEHQSWCPTLDYSNAPCYRMGAEKSCLLLLLLSSNWNYKSFMAMFIDTIPTSMDGILPGPWPTPELTSCSTTYFQRGIYKTVSNGYWARVYNAPMKSTRTI